MKTGENDNEGSKQATGAIHNRVPWRVLAFVGAILMQRLLGRAYFESSPVIGDTRASKSVSVGPIAIFMGSDAIGAFCLNGMSGPENWHSSRYRPDPAQSLLRT